MIRSILAVLGGYATLVVGVGAFFAILMAFVPGLSETDPGAPFDGPAWVLGAELAASLVVALVGGYVCAWIAGRGEVGHGAALAGFMLVMGLVSVILEAGLKPLWSSVAVAVLPAGSVLVGAWVRGRIVSGGA